MNTKYLKLIIAVLICVMINVIAIACNNNEDSSSKLDTNSSSDININDDKISLNLSSAKMDLYETLQLIPTTELEGEITWSSSDNEKASVVNGLVTSIAVGEVVIRATIGSESAECVITIESEGRIPVLSLNEDNISICEGQKFTIIPKLTYKDKNINANYEYESSDLGILTVTNGEIVAVSPGVATVTVIATYNGFVTVKILNVVVTANVLLDVDSNNVLLGTIQTIDYETTATVNAMVTVNGSVVDNPILIWETLNSDVATVENGVITSAGAGDTTVMVTYVHEGEEFTVYINVLVKKPIFDVVLRNKILDLGADVEDKVEIILTDTREDNKDLVKITNLTNNKQEVDFYLDDGKIFVDRTGLVIGENNLLIEYKQTIYNVEFSVVKDVITLIDYQSSADTNKVSVRWHTDLFASVVNDVKFEDEKGSLKLTVEKVGNNYLKFENVAVIDVVGYDYISFNVYNPTGKAIAITYLWTNHVNISTNGWAEVRLPISTIMANAIQDYDDSIISATNIAGLPIYLMLDTLNYGESIYFSSLKLCKTPKISEPEAGPETVVNFDTNADLERLKLTYEEFHSLSIDTTVKYGDEQGSLKVVVNESKGNYINIINPLNYDMSEYDYISFKIYNPGTIAFTVGTNFAGYTLCEAGKWTEIKIEADKFYEGYIMTDIGEEISITDLIGFNIKIVDGEKLSTGYCFYVSSVIGIKTA